jgi:hypothetical protein
VRLQKHIDRKILDGDRIVSDLVVARGFQLTRLQPVERRLAGDRRTLLTSRIDIISSSAGMATISIDLSFTWPSTMRCRTAKAETMWIAPFEPFFRYERREVLPSTAMT